MNKLKIVFMGTPGFAVASLKALVASRHEVVAVVTAPDRPAGRGRKLRSSDVKVYASTEGIDILQPEKLRDPEFQATLRGYGADLFIVVAFRMLPATVWEMPTLGTINLHGSLLPQYRGAAPINWAIINGESMTGVTTFFINAEIDKGHIIAKRELAILPEEDAGALHDRLMEVGAKLLVETADGIADGTVESVPQDVTDELLKAAPKLNAENRSINWQAEARVIHNLVRGLSPYPAATADLITPDEECIDCKVYKTHILEDKDLSPGCISSDDKTYIHVGTADRNLAIVEIQLSGKRRMLVEDLLNGFSIDNRFHFALNSNGAKKAT